QAAVAQQEPGGEVLGVVLDGPAQEGDGPGRLSGPRRRQGQQIAVRGAAWRGPLGPAPQGGGLVAAAQPAAPPGARAPPGAGRGLGGEAGGGGVVEGQGLLPAGAGQEQEQLAHLAGERLAVRLREVAHGGAVAPGGVVGGVARQGGAGPAPAFLLLLPVVGPG